MSQGASGEAELAEKLPDLKIAGMRPAKYCQVSSEERDAQTVGVQVDVFLLEVSHQSKR